MAKETRNETYVRVTDKAGNLFVCPIAALKDPSQLSETEMDECVDDATVGRYSGNIEIVKPG